MYQVEAVSGWRLGETFPEPAPEPEHLNQAPDGRDLGPENESPPS
jgi:hypothetical protein